MDYNLSETNTLNRSLSDASSITYEAMWRTRQQMANDSQSPQIKQRPEHFESLARDARIKQLARETRKRQQKLQERIHKLATMEEQRRKDALKKRKELMNRFDRVWESRLKPEKKPLSAPANMQSRIQLSRIAVPRPYTSPVQKVSENLQPHPPPQRADKLANRRKLAVRKQPAIAAAAEELVLVRNLPAIACDSGASSLDCLPNISSLPKKHEAAETVAASDSLAAIEKRLAQIHTIPSALEQRRLIAGHIETVRLPDGSVEKCVAGVYAQIPLDTSAFALSQRKENKLLAEQQKLLLQEQKDAIMNCSEPEIPTESAAVSPVKCSFTLQTPLPSDSTVEFNSPAAPQELRVQSGLRPVRSLMQKVAQILQRRGIVHYPTRKAVAAATKTDELPSHITEYIFQLTEQLCGDSSLSPGQIVERVDRAIETASLGASAVSRYASIDSSRELDSRSFRYAPADSISVNQGGYNGDSARRRALLSNQELVRPRTAYFSKSPAVKQGASYQPVRSSQSLFSDTESCTVSFSNANLYGDQSSSELRDKAHFRSTQTLQGDKLQTFRGALGTQATSTLSPQRPLTASKVAVDYASGSASSQQSLESVRQRPKSPWIKQQHSGQAFAVEAFNEYKKASGIPVFTRQKLVTSKALAKGVKASLPWQAEERELRLSLEMLDRALGEKILKLKSTFPAANLIKLPRAEPADERPQLITLRKRPPVMPIPPILMRPIHALTPVTLSRKRRYQPAPTKTSV